MSAGSTPILFLPGSWHGAWCWNEVIARLVPHQRPTLAVDIAGHGLTMRPYDHAELATELSPVATVDLDQAADLLLSQTDGSDVAARSRWWPTAWAAPS